jgi:two-component system sensor histidine kinase KdpD
LGAETVWLKANDVVKALIEFAREHRVTRIVIGRTHPTLWNRLLRRSIARQLILAAGDFDIELASHVDSRQNEERPS